MGRILRGEESVKWWLCPAQPACHSWGGIDSQAFLQSEGGLGKELCSCCPCRRSPQGPGTTRAPLTIHGLPMVLAGMASSQCHSHLPPLSFVQLWAPQDSLSACQQHQEGRQAGHYRVTGGHTEDWKGERDIIPLCCAQVSNSQLGYLTCSSEELVTNSDVETL